MFWGEAMVNWRKLWIRSLVILFSSSLCNLEKVTLLPYASLLSPVNRIYLAHRVLWSKITVLPSHPGPPHAPDCSWTLQPTGLYAKINILNCNINASFDTGQFLFFSQILWRKCLSCLHSLACYFYSFMATSMLFITSYIVLSFSRACWMSLWAVALLLFSLLGCQRQKLTSFLSCPTHFPQLSFLVSTLSTIVVVVPNSLVFSWTLLCLSNPSATG